MPMQARARGAVRTAEKAHSATIIIDAAAEDIRHIFIFLGNTECMQPWKAFSWAYESCSAGVCTAEQRCERI